MTPQPVKSGFDPGPQRGMIDPTSLMRIKSMELRAKVVVEGFFKGIHRSPYHGMSVEFTEYRQYSHGDDPRYIDWRVYARSDRFYIKKFEDETNLRCHMMVDHSRSMSYGSVGYRKSQYAATLAATLAYFLFSQGDAVGLACFDDRIRDYIPARNRPGHLRRLMLALDVDAAGRATNMGPPLEKMAQMLTKRGLIMLFSDLLTSTERLEKDLSYLNAAGHDLVVFNVLDPAELSFDFETPSLFEDLETGRTMHVDPAAAKASYTRKIQRHLAMLRDICGRVGVDYHLFTTDRSFDLALLDFLRDRMRRKRRPRYRSAPDVRSKA